MEEYIITDKLLTEKYSIDCSGVGNYDDFSVGSYRYELDISIKNNSNKILACIMLNPSKTFPDVIWKNKNWKETIYKDNKANAKNQKTIRKTQGFDSTVRNVIKMANAKGCSKVIVFNSFPLIEGNGTKAIDQYQKNKDKNEYSKNKNYIIDRLGELIKEDNFKGLLIAWGSDIPEDLEKFYLNEFKNLQKQGLKLLMFKWNSNTSKPYHPSQQVDNRFKIVSEFIKSNNDFEELNIKENLIITKE